MSSWWDWWSNMGKEKARNESFVCACMQKWMNIYKDGCQKKRIYYEWLKSLKWVTKIKAKNVMMGWYNCYKSKQDHR